jgi:acyl-CoA dehydrogenase
MSDHIVDEGRLELRSMIADATKRLFRDTVTDKLLLGFRADGQDGGLWQLVEETGLGHSLAGDPGEDDSLQFADVFDMFHAVGYWQAPVPLVETAIAREILAAAQVGIPDGAITIHAPANRSSHWKQHDGQWVLSGSLKEVPWARLSGHLIAVDPDQNWGLYSLQGRTAEAGMNVAHEPRDTVHAGDVWAREAGGRLPGLTQQSLLARLALTRAIVMSGAMEAALARTITYLGERVQFGRPLARFQVLQHAVAALAAEVATARAACRVAAETASGSFGDATRTERLMFDAAVAKVCAGKAASLCVRTVHQLHGAIGFTKEHPLHYATQLLWALRGESGSESFWAAGLGRAAIQRGGENFWSSLTERRLSPLV